MKKKPAAKRGRPKTGESQQVAVRLPADTIAALDAWCAAHAGVTRSTAIKMAISAWVKP